MFGLVSKKRLDAALTEIKELNAKIDLLDADLSEAQDANNTLVRDGQNKNSTIFQMRARIIAEQIKFDTLLANSAIRDPKTGRILSKEKGAEVFRDLLDQVTRETGK